VTIVSAPRQLFPLGLCAAALFAAPAIGALLPNDLQEIGPHEMQAHVDFLASDLLEGRNAGTPGAELAARYVASEFQELGLARLGDSWLMEFELGRASGSLGASITLGGARHEGSSLLEVPSGSGTGRVEGLLATESAESLEGRIVLAGDVTRLRDRRAKVEELEKKGAIAVVLLGENPWIEKSSGRRRTGMRESVAPSGGEVAATGSRARGGEPEIASGPVIEVGLSFGASGEELAPDLLQERSEPAVPVVRVCRTLGDALLEAAKQEQSVVLEVLRSGRKTTTNVLGLLPGTDPDLAGEYVIVGAHYDHVGVSSKGSVYNGADDNASGTAGVLEIAEALATAEIPPRRSVIFAAWGAEEKGLVGSRAFLRETEIPTEKIIAYINLDMIGRNAPREISATCASDTLKGWVEELDDRHGFDAEQTPGYFLNISDSGPFVAKKIPTVFFNTGMHGDLHRPSDTADKIDADKAARAARLALDVAFRATNGEIVPEFTRPDSGREGAGIQIVGSGSGSRRRLGVTPGRSEGEGIEVRRVRSDSLAEKVGLREGDRLLRIGAKELERRTDISKAVKVVKAGEEFEIEVLRTGEDGAAKKLVLKGSFEE